MRSAAKYTNATTHHCSPIETDAMLTSFELFDPLESGHDDELRPAATEPAKHKCALVLCLVISLIMGIPSMTHAASLDDSAHEDQALQEDDQSTNERSQTDMDEIVVLGTSIRGVAPSSAPLLQFAVEDIRDLGIATTEDFLRTLPQNAPTFTSSAFSGERNSPNLRGLGDGATLVLFNGRRLVSPGGITPDISFIPLNALARVDVLTDGASAIYGSDAIAGVMNFAIDDTVNGLSVSGFGGTVTDGDHDRWGATVSGGFAWPSGTLVAVYDYTNQSNLIAADREFSADLDQLDLYPATDRHSGVLAYRQELGENTQIFLDSLISSRDYTNNSPRPNSSISNLSNTSSEQLQLNGGVQVDLLDSWQVELGGVYSHYTGDSHVVQTLLIDGSTTTFDTDTEAPYVEFYGTFDGALTTLPGGDMRASLGAGYSEEEYESIRARSDLGQLLDRALTRYTTYAFGELYIPFVGPEMGIPLVHSLDFNASARYTDYSDLGSDVVPRFGIAWSLTQELTVRGTYSESFRAVPLFRMIDDRVLAFVPFDFGTENADLVQGVNNLLFIASQSPPSGDIYPEKSESISVGFDWSPSRIEGLQLSATYYEIDYEDQLGLPLPSNAFLALENPRDYQTAFDFDPSTERVRELMLDSLVFADLIGVDVTDPQSADLIDVILDSSPINLAASKVEGVDVTASYQRSFRKIDFNSSINVAYVLDLERRATPSSRPISELDTVLNPADLRLQAAFGFKFQNLSSNFIVNHIGSMSDPESTFNPDIDDWTTLDLTLKYEFNPTEDSAFLEGLVVDVSILNVFDSDPPVIGSDLDPTFPLSEPLGYDPANANPLGRYVQLRLTKTW